jgi:hypothetical protein
MTVSELKLRLFRQIDSLEKSKLEELYGVVTNYINGNKDLSEWDKLSDYQKQGLFDAIEEVKNCKETSHEEVMNKFHLKYPHV